MTEEMRARLRLSGPCADSLYVALSQKSPDSLTTIERGQLSMLNIECESWTVMQERYQSQSHWSPLLIALIPLFGIALGITFAFL
jgi:hypothetical protein